MLFHDGDEHGFGEGEIGGVELAAQGGGLLDQVGDFLQQRRVVGHNASDLGRQGLDLFLDGDASLVHVYDDALGGQRGEVIASRFDVNRWGASRARPAAAPRAGQASILKGNYLITQQAYQPADGAAEADATLVPTHTPAEADAGDEARHGLAQYLGRGPALDAPDGDDVLPAVDVAHL